MLFDAHGDILTDMYEQRNNFTKDSFKERHYKNYLEGGVTHSIFVNWTNPKSKNPNEFNEIFKYALAEIEHNKDIFKVCYNHSDMLKATQEKKIGVILGIEGIKQLENINQLKELYNKGIRHASLTWNEVNSYASGLDNLNTTGLTSKGIELVQEMQKLGMIIDLAHSNKKTFDDILNNTVGPVIISHGNAYEICNHRRNYTNLQLHKIKERNGVVGVCGIAPFISSKTDEQTVERLVDHIVHIKDEIGIDHVGLGLDVCYYLSAEVTDNKVDGFKHISDAQNIIIELRKRGLNQVEIDKISHLNFFRIVKEILG